VRVAEVHPDHVVLVSEGDDDLADAEPEVRHGHVVVAAPGLVDPVDGSSAVQTATHLVLLVLAPDDTLAAAPRGTGVLVARGSVVVARALTHVTAKWAAVQTAADGREVVRLSYERPPTLDQAQRDAEVLLGVSIPSDRVIAGEIVTWLRAARIAVNDDVPVVGEQVAGTGLAAVIAQARAVAEQLGALDDSETPKNSPTPTKESIS